MGSSFENSLTIIVRATGEATTKSLIKQIQNQISSLDTLHLIDNEVCFEDKLKYGFELGINENKNFTVFIDADILLRYNAINRIRKTIKRIDDSDLGFGFRLWDRFYDRPKFRGLHVYRTSLLSKAIEYVPLPNVQIRPESYTKAMMKLQGHDWRNGISHYVAGIHDFYQKHEDIYYKFLVRSKRSQQDLAELKQKFSLADHKDFKISLQGLEDGEKMLEVSNNKFLYKSNEFSVYDNEYNYNNQSIDLIVLKKLMRYYHFNPLFWKSI